LHSNAINKAKQKISERTEIDSDFVLKQIKEFLDYCFGRKPIKKTIVQDGVPQTVEVEEFNHAGVSKALELLGKHINVQAFKEKQEVKGIIENNTQSIIKNMTKEERGARIKELIQKVDIS